jgi:hypothetical protein
MLRFWWRTFVHAFKVFLIGYGVIKPLIRRKLPPVMDILFATLRTSSWISIAGIVVYELKIMLIFDSCKYFM